MSDKERKKEAKKLLVTMTEDRMLSEIAKKIPGSNSAKIKELLLFAASIVEPDPSERGTEYLLYVDGASIGNPGPSGIGVVIKDEKGRTIEEISEHIGVATNNVAEYQALTSGLEAIKKMGVEKIKILTDSELMAKQVDGSWRVKDKKLKELNKKASKILDSFSSYEIIHINREKNREADRLAKRGADSD
jgi:ribonuclease HI